MRKKRSFFKKNFFLPVILFLFFFIFYFIKGLRQSLFFNPKDRVNILFYKEKPLVISLGLKGDVSYLVVFDSEEKIYIPGGYNRYRTGAIGKLVFLEKKPALFQKSFSNAISSYVDFYFFLKKETIYFNSKNSFQFPTINLFLLFSPSWQTNANFFDRIYLFINLFGKRLRDFTLIKAFYFVDDKQNFLEEDFFKKYQGFFYQKFLREEKKKLIIDFFNYQSAKIISRILEGEGIWVVDLNYQNKKTKECIILTREWPPPKTAFYLKRIFNCSLKKGDTSIGDIRLILGKKEEEWE